METNTDSRPPSPPGVVQALVGGFNATASRAGVLIIPVLLDLFLWLGPRVSIVRIFRPWLDIALAVPDQQGTLLDAKTMETFFNGLNLFGFVRSFPIGPSSLMSANLDLNSPLGVRTEWALENIWLMLAVLLALALAGWLLGSLYYHFVARIALQDGNLPSVWHSLGQGLLFSIFWTAVFFIVSIPVTICLVVLAIISPALAFTVALILQFIGMWLAVAFFFSIHGIFAEARSAFKSIMNGIQLARYAFPSIGWFALTAMVMLQGLDFIWRIPPADNWLALAGIFGHAFVSTSLLAASFIYYRQMNGWILEARRWFQAQASSSDMA